MKVKIIYVTYLSSNLDEKVNEFIKGKIVRDIKYQDGENHYSCLIMYDEKGD